MKHKLAVLVSGSGTLLDAVVEADIPVALVVADRPCLGIEKAKSYGLSTVMVNRKYFKKDGQFNRELFTDVITRLLLHQEITFISMAGWMTIFSASIFEAYDSKIINNHPSLLPDFKGDNAVQDALDAGVTITGCTIHIATPELDAGPILAQSKVRVLPGDTKDTLHTRIKNREYKLLVQVLRTELGIKDA